MTVWLGLQIAWLIAAAMFNAVNLIRIQSGQTPLVGDAPRSAMLSLLLFAGLILNGLIGEWTLYRYVVIPLVFVLFVGGVLRHVRARATPADMAHYASLGVWRLAVAINVFGTFAFLGGAIAVWTMAI